jgi:hypothetical protein
MRTLTPQLIRRLAITKQFLAGARPAPTLDGLMEVLRGIRCLQIDPIRAVERTQHLVLFSRLGAHDPALLQRAAYEEKLLFEYWAHAASYVLTDDFPFFRAQMARAFQQEPTAEWSKRFHHWRKANAAFEQYVLETLRANGPTLSSEIEDRAAQPWEGGVWSSGRAATLMLDTLWWMGKVTVARRKGLRKYWDLLERSIPAHIRARPLDEPERTYQAAQFSLKALGAGTARHIKNHFLRNEYVQLEDTLRQLERDGKIVQIAVHGGAPPRGRDSAPWYLHADDLPLADELSRGNWQPRTVLLSPFDNLICDRDRTEQLWNFFFRIEIYVPPSKREYGYYVLPILHGDALIGRIDPAMNRKTHTLEVNAVYAQPDAPRDKQTARALRAAIEELAGFLGARDITFGQRIPTGWEEVACDG